MKDVKELKVYLPNDLDSIDDDNGAKND